MSIFEFEATREEWLENIEAKSNSPRSAVAYKQGIMHWDKWLMSINHSDAAVLAELKQNNQSPDSYLFLNRYVIYLTKQELSLATIRLYFAALRSWCAANGVMLFNEYIKRFVVFPKPVRELKEPLTVEQISKLVDNAPSRRVKAILLVLLSSGMRISEVLQLRSVDITPGDPTVIRVRASTTKTREERKAYMSAEALKEVKWLMDKEEDKEKTLFVSEFNTNKLISFELMFGDLRERCGLTEKYENGRYHVNVHAFRAFFHTQATNVLNDAIAHAILGHRKYLDQYFRLSTKERAENYKKLEPHVSVSSFELQKQEIVKNNDKVALLEQEIEMLKMRINHDEDEPKDLEDK